jgi:transcriptional regulator with XRE-family HTH domain
MSYLEMISRALKNRSVNSLAKAWGVKQKTLDRYVKGETLPDYTTALIIATEAGIEAGEAMRTLAEEEKKIRARKQKEELHQEAQLQEDGGPPVSRTRHQRIMSPLL